MLSQETNGERREARIRPQKSKLHELLYKKKKLKSETIRLNSEASLIVENFTYSMNDSSCNFNFNGFNLAPLLNIFI